MEFLSLRQGIGALAETVTVSGQTPLVDVTQASTATLLETEALELLPSGTNGIVAVAWCVLISVGGYLWARRLYERVPVRMAQL